MATSFLSYNGVVMDLLKHKGWHREKIYNGNQYLHTRNILAVTAAINPGTQPVPWVLIPNVGPVQNGAFAAVPAQLPQMGMVTDRMIQNLLATPRRQLAYVLSGYPIAFSPLVGFASDATGGPLPLQYDVMEIQGAKTFIVEFTIQWDVNECQLFTNEPKFLLSHTWGMEHSLDQDALTTRVIQGRAVFDRSVMDRMASLATLQEINAVKDIPLIGPNAGQLIAANPVLITPDSFRRELFHPLPVNFKRDHVEVKLLPDGCTLDYVIVDKERPLNINLENVTRLEATHAIETIWGGYAGLWESARRVVDRRVVDLTHVLNPLAIPEALAGAAVGVAFDFADSQIPQISHSLVFRVWGNKKSNRTQLTAHAHALLASRLAGPFAPALVQQAGQQINVIGRIGLNQALGALGGNFFGLPVDVNIPFGKMVPNNLLEQFPGAQQAQQLVVGGQEVPAALQAGFKSKITHDLAGKFVQLECVTLGSPFSMLLGGHAAEAMMIGGRFFGDDATLYPGYTHGAGIADFAWDARQGMPTDDLSRGSYIKQMAAAALLRPCETPPTQSGSVCPVNEKTPTAAVAVLQAGAFLHDPLDMEPVLPPPDDYDNSTQFENTCEEGLSPLPIDPKNPIII